MSKYIFLICLLACQPAYANVKFSQEAYGNALNTATDKIMVVRGGNTDVLVDPAATATGATISRTLSDHFSDTFNAADYGVTCDGDYISDANITYNTNVLSSPSRQFTSAAKGAHISLSDSYQSNGIQTTVADVQNGNLILAATWPYGTLNGNNGRATYYFKDNTGNIQNALNNLSVNDALGHNTRGYKFLLPDGVCGSGHINQPRLSVIACAGGAHACTLFEEPGTNAALIKSENYDTLHGTGINYGPAGYFNARQSDPSVPSQYGLQDIRLDCNKLGQTAGDCVDYYGNAQLILGTVIIEAGYGSCLSREASDASAWNYSDWKGFEEGLVEHLRTRNCGGYGVDDRGPHDSVWVDYVDAFSNLGGYRSTYSTGYFSGTAHFVKGHAYTENSHQAFYIGTPSTFDELYSDFAGTEVASAGVTIGKMVYTAAGYGGVSALVQDAGAFRLSIAQMVMDVWPSTTNISMLDLKAGSAVINNLASTGISAGAGVTLVNVESPFNIITGNLQNASASGDICLKLGGTNNIINLTGFNCTTFVDNSADGGQNTVNFNMYKGAGTTYVSGAFQSSDTLDINKDDGTYLSQNPATRNTSGGTETTGASPVIASGSTDCGTSPTIQGNNTIGQMTAGSGTNGGKCTITFAGSFSYAHPLFACTDITQGTVLKPVVTSTTLACTGSITAGDKINYMGGGYY